jgi:hypothetical protein
MISFMGVCHGADKLAKLADRRREYQPMQIREREPAHVSDLAF